MGALDHPGKTSICGSQLCYTRPEARSYAMFRRTEWLFQVPDW